jgi:hypothetical protein
MSRKNPTSLSWSLNHSETFIVIWISKITATIQVPVLDSTFNARCWQGKVKRCKPQACYNFQLGVKFSSTLIKIIFWSNVELSPSDNVNYFGGESNRDFKLALLTACIQINGNLKESYVKLNPTFRNELKFSVTPSTRIMKLNWTGPAKVIRQNTRTTKC